MTTQLWLLAGAILVVNLPFGYWRAACRRRSAAWFLAIHIPVLLVIGMRALLGVSLHYTTLPVTVGAFAAGQFLGSRLRGRGSPPQR
ncbi:MAG: hypothetical protein QF819_04790 [Gemmatimonadota bacterium]|jgi:hypothetical protein|nr:hypothetical protein [Gemmatimonadota bacterium]MDP6529689.1 hypothetical protein [Gemmatimonadota bacterium]MDP6802476.1 hypothetical protein [Gemmatimonadota bacterium]MDP7030967.1 hypothetical protein [Gemmatimonadota bacterium]